jgi:DNA-binding winged helix-turn-helix (wHTH) protein
MVQEGVAVQEMEVQFSVLVKMAEQMEGEVVEAKEVPPAAWKIQEVEVVVPDQSVQSVRKLLVMVVVELLWLATTQRILCQ